LPLGGSLPGRRTLKFLVEPQPFVLFVVDDLVIAISFEEGLDEGNRRATRKEYVHFF
jgi:hypothetical protein